MKSKQRSVNLNPSAPIRFTQHDYEPMSLFAPCSVGHAADAGDDGFDGASCTMRSIITASRELAARPEASRDCHCWRCGAVIVTLAAAILGYAGGEMTRRVRVCLSLDADVLPLLLYRQ
jgi:hypothetical protein